MRAELAESLVIEDSEKRISRSRLQELSTSGLVINDLDEIKYLNDGTFVFQGERVLLYIYQPYNTLPRYHLANCSTWEQMKAKGRENRYVASKRIDGLFEVDLVQHDKTVSRQIAPLSVCQNCLRKISWKNFNTDLSYREKVSRVASFSLLEFFEQKRASLIREKPLWTPETIPSARYTDDFDAISSTARRAAGWKCAKCQRVFALAWQRRYLHTHHRNGVKGDNSETNLTVLCLKDHADQPNHGHLKRSKDYYDFMKLFG